jgi:hypothetical protein
MRAIPDQLTKGPFSRAQALSLGVTPKMLRGQRFKRLHQAVYCVTDHELTRADLIEAARLALPKRVHLTGISRIQDLGLDFGPRIPVRFVIEGDHHLDLAGVFLHRTVKLPPVEGGEATGEAAYLAYCALARVLDAIKVGDWLLHNEHMSLQGLTDLATAEPWRDGAKEALWVLPYLDHRSASLPESEMRALIEFAGLPRPESNQELELRGDRTAIGDLLFRSPLLLIEYEGTHHQELRSQYTSDIERFEVVRRHGIPYLQVTKERIRRPKRLVTAVHTELLRLGYDGPAPEFGERWRSLFATLSQVSGPKGVHRRAA